MLGVYEAPIVSHEISNLPKIFSRIFGAISEVTRYLSRELSPREHEILGHLNVIHSNVLEPVQGLVNDFGIVETPTLPTSST